MAIRNRERIARGQELLQRTAGAEQARNKTRYQLTLEGMPKAGLKGWREIVTPHPDVASGRYMQAEFAADLAQVYRGQKDIGPEYRDPIEFFRRTFITTGMRDLLVGAIQRLAGKGTDPVVELQTNFGGGKTHSLLALYHLFGKTPSTDLPGVETLLKEAGVAAAPKAHRAVLVGYEFSPAQVHTEPDGTRIRTLWGHMAWQLGGRDGYAMVADSDERGTSPGAAVLGKIFKKYSPCLVLIDEWVAYARQLVGKRDLVGGDFEAQSTFAQVLTEAAKATDKTLVVASIPASKLETGGEYGELALETLKHIFERVGKPWRPASGDEGFEIVRRRLFEPITDKDAFAHRDAVVLAFSRMYKEAANDFPAGSAEESYRRELGAAYPIHPELFRRLYDDWSTLDKFQRTRGVLRLLAKVIHRLWEGGDGSLMILPASVPMDDGAVKSELTRYLPDVWEPILSQDVDGDGSLPIEIDRSAPSTMGRVSACRRVARTLYIGTAPGASHKNPGIDDRRVRLGCVQPGENVNVFGDALRRLSDRAKYIHQDGNRYWLSTKANLNRMAEDRASSLLREPETLHAEIIRRLSAEQKHKGGFAAVHACPESPADVHDEPQARLVILSPQHAHRKGLAESPARAMAADILASKGSGPRLERNCLVFLAADRKELDALLDATAQYLAWKSIHDERERLNLDPFHQSQAQSKKDDTDKTIDVRIAATWIWAIVPSQPEPTAELCWDEIKVGGSGSLGQRAADKLRTEEMLMPEMGGVRLRMELDRYLWTDKDHVSFDQLAQWFARYLYLPRIRSRETLVEAIQDGAGQLIIEDTFAIAAAWDEDKKRYRGLKAGGGPAGVIDKGTLVVKPAAARRQQQQPSAGPTPPPPPPDGAAAGPAGKTPGAVPIPPAAPMPPNLYVGSVRIDGHRIGRDAGRIAEEVIQHLSTLPGAEVEVTLEIRVRVPGGIQSEVIRTVAENATTLKFSTSSFEHE